MTQEPREKGSAEPTLEGAAPGAGVRPRRRGRIFRRAREAGGWASDYAYVAYWQVRNFFLRRDPSAYLHPEGPQQVPVVLIPGVYENWQFLRPLADYLFERGHPVHTVAPLGYNRGVIKDAAVLVERYLVEQDLHGVLVVAHSKGGLIGKHLMTLPEGARRVERMIAVNTPFSGSVYARLFPLASIRAFSPRDPFLQELLRNQEVNRRITSVYSGFDPHIPAGSHLAGARNIQLETMGHFRPIGDSRLLEVLEQELDDAGS
ncbi:alpha/beta hydrolase [Arthrobacter sp. zg-Y20]|uniref:esterase/lipase family protein n=1 Tax=unclassified Arthrobacter TaxID=235627 RepID=UPI001D15D274|nr:MULTISPECIES: alpha/beta hydrolase [unclassified Arthrobacter]MCC3276007.1 alpha/beta hydrolase [Arthrobacter sp. zg-Y20]MDK1316164.1 alpha/beta hydrolase [Arthrobacter sp. zg.Y20]WIB05554.1 alpha/beta hydrolase [Arthrobacter sp. zg-Y20]